jgi:hypothetical protein
MYDSELISDEPTVVEDPLGPVATMPAVTFGAREAALAGVGRGMAASPLDHLSAAMFTWHITCSSVTLVNGGPRGDDQTDS